MPDMCNFQETLNLALEPPPDSWAAHVDELPRPGSHVFAAQNALALALIYASMDPDMQQQLDNLREDVQELACQNENLDAYGKMVYDAARQSQQEVSKLQKQNLSLSQMIQNLARQLENTQTEILNANERVHGALEKRAASAAESNDLRRQLQEAIAELKTAALEHDADIAELRRAKISSEDIIKFSQSTISQLQAQVNLLRDEHVADRAEIEGVTAQLLEAKNLRGDLEQANARLVAESAVAKTAHNELAESMGQLQSELLTAREESNVFHDHLLDARSQLEALEADRDNLTTQNSEFEAQIGEVTDGRDSLAAEKTALQWTLRVIQDRNCAQSAWLRDAESKREALQTECDNLRMGRAEAQAELDKLTRECDLLERAHSTLDSDYSGLQSDKDALSLQLRAAEMQQKTLESERDELVDARAMLEKKGETLVGLLTEAQNKYEALSEMVRDHDSVKSALLDAQKAGEACMSKRLTAEAEVDRLQHELATACQLVEECMSKFRDAEGKRGALQKDLETASEECRRVKTDLVALQKSVHDQKPLSNQQESLSPEEVKRLGGSQNAHLPNSVEFWKAMFETSTSSLSAEQEKRKLLEAGIRTEREETTRILAAAHQATDDWKREVQIARGEQAALSRQHAALSKERDGLIRQRNALVTRRDSLQAEVDLIRNQLDGSKATLQAEITAKVADLTSQLEELGYANVGLKGALQAHKQLLEDWERQLQVALTERDRALEQGKALIKAQGKVEKDAKSAVENAAKRQAESRKSLIAERKKVASERDKLAVERDAITEERDKIKKERDKLASQHKLACDSLVAEQTMRRDAQQLHSNATVLLQDQENELAQLNSRVAELQKQLEVKDQLSHTKKLQGEISKLRRELTATQKAYNGARFQAEQVEQMRNDLVQETAKSAQAEIKNLDLEKLLKSRTEENAKLTQKVEKLDRHLRGLRNRLDELKDVRAENERLCNQIDELENPKRKVSRSA